MFERQEIDCPVCDGCDNWNLGEGTDACLECEKMARQLPSMRRGEFRCGMVYLSDLDDHSPWLAREPEYGKNTIGYHLKEEMKQKFDHWYDGRLKQVLSLILDDNNLTEAARLMGVSKQVAHTYYKRALKRIKKEVRKNGKVSNTGSNIR